MATENAYPVLRTRDLSEAVAVARELLALADLSDTTVRLHARATEPDEWQRLSDALPGAWSTRGPFGENVPPGPDGGPDLDRRYLPVEVQQEEAPVGSVEDAFFAAVGANPATLEWWPLPWPAVPELGLQRYLGAYSGVEVLVNSRALYLEEPSEDHTVLIHVQGLDLPRARWLAARIGREVIGPELFVG